MFSVTSNTFDKNLYLTKRVSYDVITEEYLRYFDNDGFELSYLEQEYYRENGVKLNHILNHSCDQKPWMVGGDTNFKLDHSMLLQRWSFEGEAKDQLERMKKTFPQLNKYLSVVPKWGIDFALEYYNNNHWIEVLHIELDYRNYEEALEKKDWFQNKLKETDWPGFVKSLVIHKSEWEALPGMQQNDWKAAYWGLQKAEYTQKAFL